MFTGIIETTGEVLRIRPGELAIRTRLKARLGDSVAVNGACLTVVAKHGGVLHFDVLEETIRRTNFDKLCAGSLVNLERPLRADARLDGHFVLGHVDATGVVRRFEKAGKDYVLEVAAPAVVMKYIIEKGSIAVDGISLTIAGMGRGWFRAWIIPHTREMTNLSTRRKRDRVNLEADILGKYAEKLMRRRRG